MHFLLFPKKLKAVWVNVSFEVYNAYNLTSSDLLPVVFLSSNELLLPGVLGKSVRFFKGFHSLKEEAQQGFKHNRIEKHIITFHYVITL